MSARDAFVRASRRHHCRYYSATTFAEALTEHQQDGVEAALRATTITTPNGEARVDPETVTVTDAFAVVAFTHGPEARHRPGAVAGEFFGAIGEWANRNGYRLEDVRAGHEWGTLPASPLPVEADTDRVIERLEGGLADDRPAPAQNHYIVATPNREPTADEREVLEAAAESTDEDLVVTPAGALVVFDPSHPRWDFAPITRCQQRLRRTLPGDTELGGLAYWDYELGTLGRLDDAAREAVRQRARQQVSYEPTDATDGEVSTRA